MLPFVFVIFKGPTPALRSPWAGIFLFEFTFVFLAGVGRCIRIFFAVLVMLINQIYQQRVVKGGTFYTQLDITIYSPFDFLPPQTS